MDKKAKEFEQQRVDTVIKKVKTRLAAMREQLARANQETNRIEQNYGDNTKVNVTEVDDRMETNAAVQQQKQMVARAVESEVIMNEQVDRLAELELSPYFGRIDIAEDGDKETLYIGTATFLDEDQTFLVYDWRAPIASIYYNGTLGEVDYETPAGMQHAALLLKRQFLIQNGQIEHLFDTNETVGDEMLQHVLGNQNDTYMQNIVSTIQREQNSIIRNTQSDLLLVQGVAGSGKTSAILQRIAYLLYHSRKDLSADQMVLFSPNRLFSHYISEVLPSLGEKNMRQVTLDEFLTGRFTGIHVESLFERLERDLASLPEPTKTVRRFKESTAFMTELTQYVASLTPDNLHFTDLLFEGLPFFTKTEIGQIYAALPANMTPIDKFAATKKRLFSRLHHRIKKELKADWVADLVSLLDNSTYHTLTKDKVFQNADAEYDYLAEQLITQKYTVIEEGIYNDYFLDTYEQYGHFLQQLKPAAIPNLNWLGMIHSFYQSLERHYINLEDAVPILYLRDLLTGSGVNHSIQYLFIDEMQDYSLAQLLYIHHAFPKAKLTLLGDEAQDVFTSVYADTSFLTSVEAAFSVKKVQVITLNKSYRSTAPITNFAKQLLLDHSQIEAFNRKGPKPVLLECNQTTIRTGLANQVNTLLKDYKTVAILTKDMGTAQQVYATLPVSAETTLIFDGDRNLPTGVLVLPLYLAKGLEFDAVIGYDISANTYGADSDRDLLYTLASRAMHRLILISIDTPSPLLENMDNNHFERIAEPTK